MIDVKHKAWRFKISGEVTYVESIRKPGERGDKYTYTAEESKALEMTETQCKAFCKYMRDCDSIGFWS